MDYLAKYGQKSPVRKFQEGGPAAPPPAGPEGAPAGGGVSPDVEAAAQLLMQIAEAAMSGDPQAGDIALQIAQAVSGGGAEGGAPPPAAANGAPVYRQGGRLSGPVFGNRSTLVARR